MLCVGEALVGRQPKPPCRFAIVLRDAFGGGVHDPEVVLRKGVPLLREHLELGDLATLSEFGDLFGRRLFYGRGLLLRATRHSERRETQHTGKGDSAGVIRHRLAPTTTTTRV